MPRITSRPVTRPHALWRRADGWCVAKHRTFPCACWELTTTKHQAGDIRLRPCSPSPSRHRCFSPGLRDAASAAWSFGFPLYAPVSICRAGRPDSTLQSIVDAPRPTAPLPVHPCFFHAYDLRVFSLASAAEPWTTTPSLLKAASGRVSDVRLWFRPFLP